MSTKRDLRWQGYYSVSTNWDWGIFQCPQNGIRVKFYVHIYGYIIDTMVSKFGKKFEDVSKLFDHAAHNGSNYLNGHCFVSLMLCVPVWNRNRISYLAVPLGYRMWQKKESKLEPASAMVRHDVLTEV